MNDIATVVIEHRNSAGELVDKSEEFDVYEVPSYDITQRIYEFIRTKTLFPADKIVVAEIKKED